MIVLTLVALLLITHDARADGLRRAGKALLISGGASLVLVVVFGGLLGYAESSACYRGQPNSDGCEATGGAGFYGAVVNGVNAAALLTTGLACYASGKPDPVTTGQVLQIRF
jgi:hypothetical protein